MPYGAKVMKQTLKTLTMQKFKTVFICAGILLSFKIYSQNIPLGTLPMLYNGGFAGEAQQARFNAGVSLYKGINPDYKDNTSRSYFVSYDQFIKKLSTGVGITVLDNASTFNHYSLTTSQQHRFVVASIAPKISFSGKYTLTPFVNIIYSDSKYRMDSYQPLLDSINQRYYAYLKTQPKHTISQRFGVMLNTRKFYFGLSFNSLNRSPQSLINDVNHYSNLWQTVNNSLFGSTAKRNNATGKGASWIFQAGRTFQKLPTSKFSVTPQIVWQYLRFRRTDVSGSEVTINRNCIDTNIMFRYDKLIASINNNGLGLGYQNNNFRFLLSQNLVFLAKRDKYATVSMRYVLKAK